MFWPIRGMDSILPLTIIWSTHSERLLSFMILICYEALEWLGQDHQKGRGQVPCEGAFRLYGEQHARILVMAGVMLGQKDGGLFPVAHLCDALVSWIHGCLEKWRWQSGRDRRWLHWCQRVCRGIGNTVVAFVVVLWKTFFNHFHVSDHVRVAGSSHTDHIPFDGWDHFGSGWWRVRVRAYLSVILLGRADSCEERLWQWVVVKWLGCICHCCNVI